MGTDRPTNCPASPVHTPRPLFRPQGLKIKLKNVVYVFHLCRLRTMAGLSSFTTTPHQAKHQDLFSDHVRDQITKKCEKILCTKVKSHSPPPPSKTFQGRHSYVLFCPLPSPSTPPPGHLLSRDSKGGFGQC